MKKLLSLLIVVALLLPFGLSAAFAEGSEELVTFTILSVTDSTQLNYRDTENSKVWPYIHELLAKRGLAIEMEVLEADQYKTALTTRIGAGMELPDMICLQTMDDAGLANLITNGMIVSLDDIIAYSEDPTSIESAAFQLSPEGKYYLSRLTNSWTDGKCYFLQGIAANSGIDIGTYGLFDSFSLQIRVDWLEKLGLEMPASLDDLTNVLREFQQQDVNGDGVQDERMVINAGANFNNSLAQLFGLAPFVYSVDESTNEFVTPLDQEGFIPYIEYLAKLYDEGLFDPTEGDQLTALLAADKVSVAHHVSAHPSYYKMSPDPNAYMTYIPTFDAIEGITGTHTYQLSMMLNGPKWAFTTNVLDKMEATAKLLDFWFSEDYWLFHTMGVEGLSYKFDENDRPVETFRIDYPTVDLQREAGIASGYWYGGPGVLPRMTGGAVIFRTIEQQLWPDYHSLVNSEFYKARYQVYENIGARGAWGSSMKDNMWPEGSYYNMTTPYFAMPTVEELNIMAEYSDLSTRIEEIIINMIMGNYSTEDWPGYREELTSLGFDEVCAVYKARTQRVLDVMNAKD